MHRSCRESIIHALKKLNPTTVWLPIYLCESVFTQISALFPISFYPVNSDLDADLSAISALIRPTDVLFATSILGSSTLELVKQASQRCSVIADITHCFFDSLHFNELFPYVDSAVCSLRKILPYPDGGLLISHVPNTQLFGAFQLPTFSILKSMSLILRDLELLFSDGNGLNLQLSVLAEGLLSKVNSTHISRASLLTRSLFQLVDTFSIYDHVFSNRQYLRAHLSSIPGISFPTNSSLVSSYLPIRLTTEQTRDHLRDQLRHLNIFCPVHWPSGYLLLANHPSKYLLSLPCDYRYTHSHMRILSSSISSIIKPET